MTDKQLKKLSKTQLVNLLYQQELEIEKLKTEPDDDTTVRPGAKSVESSLQPDLLSTDAALIEGIVRAAQEAAAAYVKKVKDAEDERLISVSNMEKEAQERLKKSEEQHEKTTAAAQKVINEIDKLYEWQINRMNSLYAEFRDEIRNMDPIRLLGQDEATSENELPEQVSDEPESENEHELE